MDERMINARTGSAGIIVTRRLGERIVMMMKLCVRVFCAILLCGIACAADVPLPPLQEPLGGILLLHGGGKVSEDVRGIFIKASGGTDARIVVISSGSDEPGLITAENRMSYFGVTALRDLVILHAATRAEAEKPEFADVLKKATGVWIEGERQAELERYVGTPVETELHALLKRGGTVAGISAGAALCSRTLLPEPKSTPEELRKGFGFLEGVIVAAHFKKPERQKRLENAVNVATHGHAGFGIEEETTVIIEKRWMTVIGSGELSILYPRAIFTPSKDGMKEMEAKTVELKARDRADLLTVSRAALARTGEIFPPGNPGIPEVPAGAMLVIGGSGISNEGTKRFITHCGGVSAKIVVIPTALDDEPTREPYEVKILRNLGVKDVTVVHAKTRAEAETAAVLDPIRKATGIWFSGGRQWRLVDKYLGTSAEKEMHAVLTRGGAIAGGSAGATIQGDYLVRGNPLGNVEMMVEGYERGLGFLIGVAIDQHFSQRKRFADMTAFKKEVPHYLGIGIDENTALVVTGHVAEIVGEHVVSFYDKEQPLPEGAKDYTVIRSGESYDLKERRKK